MATADIARRLVDMYKQGQVAQLVNELYAPDAVSQDTITGKGQWWILSYNIERTRAVGPYRGPKEDQFYVRYDFLLSSRHTGNKAAVSRYALYTVRDDKIVQAVLGRPTRIPAQPRAAGAARQAPAAGTAAAPAAAAPAAAPAAPAAAPAAAAPKPAAPAAAPKPAAPATEGEKDGRSAGAKARGNKSAAKSRSPAKKK